MKIDYIDYVASYTQECKINELKKEIEILERKLRREKKENLRLESALKKAMKEAENKQIEIVNFHRL